MIIRNEKKENISKQNLKPEYPFNKNNYEHAINFRRGKITMAFN